MERAVLENLIAQGQTLRQIAKSLQSSATNVRYWLRKYDLHTHRGPKGHLRPEDVLNRKCPCGETDPTKFYGVKRFKCAKCHSKYMHDKGKETRARAVASLGGKCSRCGYNRCLPALGFHHIDPKQKDPGFQHLRGWSWKKVEAELKKCILVCSNCHAEIHEELKESGV